MVYLREAHPKDGWSVPNWSELDDPTDLEGRKKAARYSCKELKFDFPTVVDNMDDSAAVRWSSWPERLFVISKQGKVVFSGDQGPWGFNPGVKYKGLQGRRIGISLEDFLKAYLADPSNGKTWY